MPDTTVPDLVLKSLVCPRCRVAVELCKTGDLCCTQCNATFPVREGLPIMLFDDSRLFQRFSVTGDVTLEALDPKGQPRDLAPVQGELATMSRAGFALICRAQEEQNARAISYAKVNITYQLTSGQGSEKTKTTGVVVGQSRAEDDAYQLHVRFDAQIEEAEFAPIESAQAQ